MKPPAKFLGPVEPLPFGRFVGVGGESEDFLGEKSNRFFCANQIWTHLQVCFLFQFWKDVLKKTWTWNKKKPFRKTRWILISTLPKTNVAPENQWGKRLVFRCELLVSGKVGSKKHPKGGESPGKSSALAGRWELTKRCTFSCQSQKHFPGSPSRPSKNRTSSKTSVEVGNFNHSISGML